MWAPLSEIPLDFYTPLTITPSDTCLDQPPTTTSPLVPPDSPKNNSPLIPPDSPPQNSTIQALLNLAVGPPPQQDDPTFYKVYHHSQQDNRLSPPNLPQVPESYSKLPEILTAAIKPIYNGSVPSFFTFLFQLHKRCSICHFWASATYYATIDLLNHFVDINLDPILFNLSLHWIPTF